ncbi:MAG: SAP domain-containing protein [Deltaproteobacteria bacterium]|nr:SAP domain-containing protein [Deltaproteobacteria bacterium]
MHINDVRKIAKKMSINTYHIIRAIQRAEENPECFGTERVFVCGEMACLWRGDCIAYVKKKGVAWA